MIYPKFATCHHDYDDPSPFDNYYNVFAFLHTKSSKTKLSHAVLTKLLLVTLYEALHITGQFIFNNLRIIFYFK